MLYVLVKKDTKYYVKTFNGFWNDGTCYNINMFNRRKGMFKGVFGILDYAIAWRDFNNKKINRTELRSRLEWYS